MKKNRLLRSKYDWCKKSYNHNFSKAEGWNDSSQRKEVVFADRHSGISRWQMSDCTGLIAFKKGCQAATVVPCKAGDLLLGTTV